ncbi:hypothetical protein C8R47DRAFT_249355 [Mycena vitilis]|nr:hypothetical protein C8R47DRAFT_249355 [Mycena vitilis]
MHERGWGPPSRYKYEAKTPSRQGQTSPLLCIHSQYPMFSARLIALVCASVAAATAVVSTHDPVPTHDSVLTHDSVPTPALAPALNSTITHDIAPTDLRTTDASYGYIALCRGAGGHDCGAIWRIEAGRCQPLPASFVKSLSSVHLWSDPNYAFSYCVFYGCAFDVPLAIPG